MIQLGHQQPQLFAHKQEIDDKAVVVERSLDLRTHVVGAYIDGRALDLSDRQKRLYERYRNRPKPGGTP